MPPYDKLKGQQVTQVCFQKFYLSIHLESGDYIMSHDRASFEKNFGSLLEIVELVGKTIDACSYNEEDSTLTFEIDGIRATLLKRDDGFESYEMSIDEGVYVS